MKKLMYIFLALPILTGCKEKKSTGAMGGMPTSEISVTKPIGWKIEGDTGAQPVE